MDEKDLLLSVLGLVIWIMMRHGKVKTNVLTPVKSIFFKSMYMFSKKNFKKVLITLTKLGMIVLVASELHPFASIGLYLV